MIIYSLMQKKNLLNFFIEIIFSVILILSLLVTFSEAAKKKDEEKDCLYCNESDVWVWFLSKRNLEEIPKRLYVIRRISVGLSQIDNASG